MALDADAFLGNEDERRDFIKGEFSDRFDSRLDENNWFHHLAAFFRDGSYLMGPKSEPGIFADIPAENRWDAVRRYALRCVAVDFRLFGASTWTLGDNANEGNKKTDEPTALRIYELQPSGVTEPPAVCP